MTKKDIDMITARKSLIPDDTSKFFQNCFDIGLTKGLIQMMRMSND